ncbi:MAG: hypothetical protein K2O45_13800 [Oscillospiraceae bacterium]|nr:hypothetical protein [Oscillospiraceae bacterium]
MNRHHSAARKAPLFQNIRSWFQSATRCYPCSEGTAFERKMQARFNEEAHYASVPMPRF